MNLLAIETSTEWCSVSLVIDDQQRDLAQHAPRLHAELLLPWVTQLLSEADVSLTALDAIAFSRGPGSFTSLRIGIGVVQGLAWGADIPVIPVSSLQLAAQNAASNGVSHALVALDARMEEVFCARFSVDDDGVMQANDQEQVLAPTLAAELASGSWTGVGNGFERYQALGRASTRLEAVIPDIWPLARELPVLARAWAQSNAPLAAAQAQPVYIRDNVARKVSEQKKQ